MSITKVCGTCGSTHVHYDASATWSEPEQEWVLGVVTEDGFCGDCDAECEIEDKVIEE